MVKQIFQILPFVFLWYCYPQVKACCKVCMPLTDQMWGIPDQILTANGPTANGLAVGIMVSLPDIILISCLEIRLLIFFIALLPQVSSPWIAPITSREGPFSSPKKVYASMCVGFIIKIFLKI